MKRIISALLLLIVGMPIVFMVPPVYAEDKEPSGICGTANWRYEQESKTLYIEGGNPKSFVTYERVEYGPAIMEAGFYVIHLYDSEVEKTPWQDLDFENVVFGEGVTCIPSGTIQRKHLKSVTLPDGPFRMGTAAFMGKTSDSSEDEEDYRIGSVYLSENTVIERSWNTAATEGILNRPLPIYCANFGFYGYKIGSLELDGFPLDKYYLMLRDQSEKVTVNDAKYDSLTCEVSMRNSEDEEYFIEYDFLNDGKEVCFSSDYLNLCRKYGLNKYSYSIKSKATCRGVPYTQIKDRNYKDLVPGKWYYEAVKYECESGGFAGMDMYTFGTNIPITRAMLATLLYNDAGKESSLDETAANFGDVPAGKWYTKPILWARQKGIIAGVDYTHFMPNVSVTRQDMAVMLYSYARFRGQDVSGRADLSRYPDNNNISGYAMEAFSWAVNEGYIAGTRLEDGTVMLDPAGETTRAQMACVMMRYHLKNGAPCLN